MPNLVCGAPTRIRSFSVVMLESNAKPVEVFTQAPTRQERFLHAVVCCVTRNNAQMLRDTLLSLSKIMLPTNTAVSFVVVENDVEKKSGFVLEDAAPKLLGGSVVHILEPQIGIAQARNTAVRTALDIGADVVLFIDDDETITENWLDRMLCEYRSGRAMLIGGPTMPRFIGKSNSFVESLVRAGSIAQHARFIRKIKKKLVLHQEDQAPVFTKNWLADADVFRNHSIYFDTSIVDDSGHDIQFFNDVVSAGLPTGWCLDAFVFKRVPTERTSLRHQFKSGLEQAKIAMHAKRRHRTRIALLPNLLLSLMGRCVSLVLAILHMPFSKGRSIVGVMRHSGWIAGRISAFLK